ncbi:hypothetical protein [Stenoxybacter acetivorans]|uniref:hypothetical protein n=1 Tax=Stenoxybacter acetivorans TaxID=422441 RepID=UPI000560CDD5|nr:hypothetical protein [Stenoxybacter acetivorans]
MNDLIWLVYLADVLCRVGSVLLIIALLSSGVLSFHWFILGMDGEAERFKKAWFALPICFALLASLIPSKQTVYTILAVKTTAMAVEEVRQNTLWQKGIKLLEQRLDEALAEPKNE